MRILRLELGGELGGVDLHPLVTVLHGLDPGTRQEVVDAVAALAAGRAAGVGALVEDEGLLLHLAPDEPLTLAPGPPRHVTVDLDRPPAAGHDPLPGLVARLDQLRRQADIDAAVVEEVRNQLDLPAAARLARLAPVDRPAPVDPAPGRAEVAAALAAWAATPATVRTSEPWVGDLARQWDDHQRRGEACAERLVALQRRTEAASRRLAAAMARLDEAQAAARPVLLSAEEENRLAELATRPAGRGRLRQARGRSEEDQAEIDALLGRVDQPTYAAYVMFRLAPTPPPAQLAAVQAARAAVTSAEVELATATAALDDDPELVDHRQREDALRAVAARHLGPVLPQDLREVLRGLGDDRPNPQRHDARLHLAAAAARHGLACPPDIDDAALAARVEGWLADEAPPPPASAEQGGPDELDELARRVAGHRRALQRLEGLERRARCSRRLADELERWLATPAVPPPVATAALDAVERLADELVADGAGAAPLILTGDLDGLGDDEVHQLLERLELEARRVQLVVVTDHPAAGRWAVAAGLHRALGTGARPTAG